MGITIHYSGRLDQKEDVYRLIDELVDIAGIMNWQYSVMDRDWTKPLSAKMVQKAGKLHIEGHMPIKGVDLLLHPSCEWLYFDFDPDGHLCSPLSLVAGSLSGKKMNRYGCSVKTQFAPVDVHISIIRLLDFLKKMYVPDLKVYDEGGYWESRNREQLIEKINFINEAMDKVEEAIAQLDRNDIITGSAEELAKLLEDIIKRKRR